MDLLSKNFGEVNNDPGVYQYKFYVDDGSWFYDMEKSFHSH